jgi:hypothetical protein
MYKSFPGTKDPWTHPPTGVGIVPQNWKSCAWAPWHQVPGTPWVDLPLKRSLILNIRKRFQKKKNIKFTVGLGVSRKTRGLDKFKIGVAMQL